MPQQCTQHAACTHFRFSLQSHLPISFSLSILLASSKRVPVKEEFSPYHLSLCACFGFQSENRGKFNGYWRNLNKTDLKQCLET